MAESSSELALVRRQAVPPGRPYGAYREALREDFVWSCAYCSMTELEARAIRFEIDHYVPRAKSGTDAYENLYYACEECNSRKGDWVTTPTLRDNGLYVIQVDLEDPRRHLSLNGSEPLVAPITSTGKLNIELFDLNNRTSLREIRGLRRRAGYSREIIQDGLRVLRSLSVDRLAKEHRAAFMRFREDLQNNADQVERANAALIASLCKSSLINPDPNKAQNNKERRAYLKSIDAFTPPKDLAVPVQPRRPPSRAPHRRRRRRGK